LEIFFRILVSFFLHFKRFLARLLLFNLFLSFSFLLFFGTALAVAADAAVAPPVEPPVEPPLVEAAVA
jgi:hypothetical protein